MVNCYPRFNPFNESRLGRMFGNVWNWWYRRFDIEWNKYPNKLLIEIHVADNTWKINRIKSSCRMNLDNLRFFCISSISNLKQCAIIYRGNSRIRYDSLFSFSDIGIFLCKPVISRNATSNAPSSRINSRREHFFVSFMRAPCSSLPLLLFFVCPTCVTLISCVPPSFANLSSWPRRGYSPALFHVR